MTKQERQKIVKEKYLEMTNPELANLVGCYRQTIVRDLKELGLTRRIKMKLLKDEKFYSLKRLGFSRYKVSNKGRIINEKGNIIKPTYTPDRYLSIKMVNDNGKRVTNRLSRIVALRLIPNPKNKPEVNHKDGNKENNSVENLEWASRSYNQLHAIRNGLINKYDKKTIHKICKLIKIGKSDKEIAEKLSLPNNYGIGYVYSIRKKKIRKDISDLYFK